MDIGYLVSIIVDYGIRKHFMSNERKLEIIKQASKCLDIIEHHIHLIMAKSK